MLGGIPAYSELHYEEELAERAERLLTVVFARWPCADGFTPRLSIENDHPDHACSVSG